MKYKGNYKIIVYVIGLPYKPKIIPPRDILPSWPGPPKISKSLGHGKYTTSKLSTFPFDFSPDIRGGEFIPLTEHEIQCGRDEDRKWAKIKDNTAEVWEEVKKI